MKKTVAIIQARCGSSRFPNKVLQTIGSGTIIEHVITRVSQATRIDQVILAVPDTPEDTPLIRFTDRCQLSAFKGSRDDVLDRYYRAAKEHASRTIVRITGDCPLIAPELIDECIKIFQQSDYDYVTNHVKPSYPRGFDCEVFSMNALEAIWQRAKRPYEREHVTPFLYEHPDEFRVYDVLAPPHLNRPNYRVCVDTPEDLTLVKKIFEAFPGRMDMTAEEIINILDKNPDWVKINRHIQQKELREPS